MSCEWIFVDSYAVVSAVVNGGLTNCLGSDRPKAAHHQAAESYCTKSLEPDTQMPVKEKRRKRKWNDPGGRSVCRANLEATPSLMLSARFSAFKDLDNQTSSSSSKVLIRPLVLVPAVSCTIQRTGFAVLAPFSMYSLRHRAETSQWLVAGLGRQLDV